MDKIAKNLFLLYLISFGFYTLYNPKGILPFCLIFSFIIIFNYFFIKNKLTTIIFPKTSFIDLALILFLLFSVLSVLLNINNNLNYNHLYSHFVVIICYYFSIRIFCNTFKFEITNDLIIKYLTISFFIIFLTVLTDQTLLALNINIANYLPMESSNQLVGVGFFTRARGFFVEPTDLALGINSIAPFLLFYYYPRNTKYFIFSLVAYLLLLILTRSTAGFIELFFGLFVCFIDLFSKLNTKTNLNFTISFKKLKYLYSIFFLLIILYFSLLEPILTAYEEATKKLNISNTGRKDVRVEFWENTINLFNNSSKIFTGFGTGFTTLNQKTFNWYLTILIENGIFGFLIILSLIFYTFFKIYRINNSIKFAFYISFSSATLHLATQTGFYYPFLWILLVLVQLDWNFIDKNNT